MVTRVYVVAVELLQSFEEGDAPKDDAASAKCSREPLSCEFRTEPRLLIAYWAVVMYSVVMSPVRELRKKGQTRHVHLFVVG